MENPINDLPSQEEIGEKPYYDDESAPTAQLLFNNNQNQNEKPNDDIQDNMKIHHLQWLMTINFKITIQTKIILQFAKSPVAKI